MNANSPDRPNILYIHSHDTGRYIQPYGYCVDTPSLQQFAERSTVFRQAFCVNPTCSPSRASLLTGCYPHQNGMLGLAHRGYSLNDYKQHLIHTLKPAGYHAALAGIQHIAHGDRSATDVIGYDESLPVETLGVPYVSDAVQAFLRREHDKPFFLSAGFFETHRKFPEEIDPQDDPCYLRPPAIFPDTPENRLDFARFRTMARRYDNAVGRILYTLEQTGLADNTIVLITTDHGVAFPEMKCNLTSHGAGVLMMLHLPPHLRPGGKTPRVVDAMVSHLDVFPTLCELLNLEPPSWLEGKSLMPLMRGETDRLHDALFTTVNVHASYEPMRSVRTDRFSYIRRFDGRDHIVRPNIDDSLTKTTYLESGGFERPVAQEQLYDLMLDPMERYNVATDPRYADALADMRQRLERFMRDTSDPLAQGVEHLPWPEQAILNDPGDPSTQSPLQIRHRDGTMTPKPQ